MTTKPTTFPELFELIDNYELAQCLGVSLKTAGQLRYRQSIPSTYWGDVLRLPAAVACRLTMDDLWAMSPKRKKPKAKAFSRKRAA